MKNICVLILLSFFCLETKAQHTLTAAFNPIAGDMDNSSSLDTNGLFLGSSGPSQTWNYSGVTVTPFTTSSSTYMPMSSVPNSFMFPGATIASYNGTGNYIVYSNTSAKIEEMGQANAAVSNCILYSNAIKYYSVPFSFGSTSSDAFSLNIPSSYTITGNITTTGDATGTLQLPSGVYSNVLKLRLDVIESLSLGSSITTYTITQSRYYSSLSKFPLLVVSFQTYTSTTGSGFNKSGQINSILATSITSRKPEADMLVFPNPVSSGELFISNTDPSLQKMTIEINNVLDQNLKTISFENQSGTEPKKIDVSDLAKGIYYLKISGKEFAETRKIIIE